MEDFTYLGSRIRDIESDIRVMKGRVWGACHTLKKLWNSKLRKSIKIRVFTTLVESVLLYGSETWTMTKRLEKMVDGCYTRMLRMALNINQYRLSIPCQQPQPIRCTSQSQLQDNATKAEGSDLQVILIDIRS